MKQWRGDWFSLTAFEITSEQIYEGIHDPAIRWNGWAMPYLTTEAARQLINDQAEWFKWDEMPDDESLHIAEMFGVFVEVWKTTDGRIHAQPVQTFTIDGETFHAIGAGSWCWDEAEEGDTTEGSYLCDNCGELMYECYASRKNGKCIQ